MTTSRSGAPPAIRLRGVVQHFPEFDLGPIELELPRGAVLGLLGENGAGKSTLLRILLGLLRPDAGTVELDGLPMPACEREIKAGTGFVSEDMALYRGATIAWHLAFVRSLCPVWDDAYAEELLDRFALRRGQRTGGLSRGQTVRLMLLLALVRRPRLLLLDEPTTGLDPRVRHELRQELAALAAERRTTILFSSHLLEDVECLADEIVFLHRGRIVRRIDRQAISRPGALAELFLGATCDLPARVSERALA